MQFQLFSEYLQKLENISSRNHITTLLAELYSEISIEESKRAMYLLLGRLAPKFVPVEFNFSQKLIIKALETLVNDTLLVKEIFKETGDVGLVAEKLSLLNHFDAEKFSKIEKLTAKSINHIYTALEEIAFANGSGSQERKINAYLKIVASLEPLSVRYVTRIIVGTIRLGLSEKTILDSLSWFIAGDKSLRDELDLAYGKKADLGELFLTVLKVKKQHESILHGVSLNSQNENNLSLSNLQIESNQKLKQSLTNELQILKVSPGIPISSKLVEREASSEGVWERMPNCFVQPKLDGLRGQLHYSASNFPEQPVNSAIFSRNMETMTDQFPELTDALKDLGVDSIILDSEIIGFDTLNNAYLSYQETMQRKRKNDIGEYSKNIPVRAMCFDILYLNGEDLTLTPIEKRLEILKKLLEKSTSPLRMLETFQMNSEDELETYFKSKVENGLEGIITKKPGTFYDPGTRNFKWIKLKANSRSDLVDTIDVTVLGYYYGKGDRSRFGFGTLLAGVYEPSEDKYYSIGKVGSGFSEEMMTQIFKDLQDIITLQQPENVDVDKILHPDVWVKPKIVMEIIADEITRSPAHTAAKGISSKVLKDDSSKGLSIRFPRMKIWKRDKDYPNTVSEIIRMYELRKGKN